MIDALRAWITAIGDPAWIIGAAVSAVATWGLARLARRAGWVDDGVDAPERKLQSEPVPLVGGAALLLGLIAAQCVRSLAHQPGIVHGAMLAPLPGLVPAVELTGEVWIWGAIALAFGIGLIDDLAREGLRPMPKVFGQVLVGCVLAQSIAAGTGLGGWLSLVACVAFAIIALNAVNTFDNADGAAASLGILGLSVVLPACAAPLCGFLPFNVWIRADPRSTTASTAVVRAPHSSPRAYLGDAGSHVIGVLFLLHPVASALLALPLLDLLRLCVVRTRSGVPIWHGDRRHIAHRFMHAGMSPTAVVLMLALLSIPALVGGLSLLGGAAPYCVWLGWTGVAILLLVAVRCTPSTG